MTDKCAALPAKVALFQKGCGISTGPLDLESVDRRVLCRFHVLGQCRYGTSCRFSHDLTSVPSQVRPDPGSTRPCAIVRALGKMLTYTIMSCQVCSYFLAGHCAYGKQCKFAHLTPDGASAERDPSSQRLPAAHAEAPRSSQPAAASGSRAAEPPRGTHAPGAADGAWHEGGAEAGAALEDPRLPENFLDTPRADRDAEQELSQQYQGRYDGEHAVYGGYPDHGYQNGYSGEGNDEQDSGNGHYAHYGHGEYVEDGRYAGHEPQIIDDDEAGFTSEDSIEEAVRQVLSGLGGRRG